MMRPINPPRVNDIRELQALAANEGLGSYPMLRNNYILFRDQYFEYIRQCGDPWSINPLSISQGLHDALLSHYKSPPTGRLEFILTVRYVLSSNTCPMCGSSSTGEVDHYLPKSDYPEYAFFSWNLVPACKCNLFRSTKVKGGAPSERPIHPYFDAFMDERLFQSRFEGGFESPSIDIEVVDINHQKADVIKFHLEAVIKNIRTFGWFDEKWSDLSLRPHDILNAFLPRPPAIITGNSLKVSVETLRNHLDSDHGTPNNWGSIFYTGLLHDQPRLDQLAVVINNLRS